MLNYLIFILSSNFLIFLHSPFSVFIQIFFLTFKSNFVTGLEKKDRGNIYLIDFGIAKCIIGENGEIKKQEGGGFR